MGLGPAQVKNYAGVALLLLLPLAVLADEIPPLGSHVYSQDEMFNITAQAAAKRQDVALLLQNSEKWFWKETHEVGLEKDILVPIASVAAPIVSRKFSTRGLHMEWGPAKNLTLRPDLDYYFDTTELKLAFTATWRF
jgi:hypothetical protein